MNQVQKSLKKLSISHKECKILFFQATENGENIKVQDIKDVTIKYGKNDQIHIKIRKLSFKFNPGNTKTAKIISLLTDEYGVDVLDDNDDYIRVDYE